MSTLSTSSRGETVAYEQAVYGSFSFWDQGYAILAQSPGCRKEWLDDFRHACQRYGERPASAGEAPALFNLKLKSGPWVVVGVFPQGRDDAGRPGALAFHGIFLKGADYRRAGASPFLFSHLHRDGWTAADRQLAAGRIEVPEESHEPIDIEEKVSVIARAIAAGRQVLVESPVPIGELAAQVWTALPARVRAKATMATWAFSTGNKFNLTGMPRIHLPVSRPCVSLDTLLEEKAVEVLEASIERPSHKHWRRLIWGLFFVFAVLVVWLSWRGS